VTVSQAFEQLLFQQSCSWIAFIFHLFQPTAIDSALANVY